MRQGLSVSISAWVVLLVSCAAPVELTKTGQQGQPLKDGLPNISVIDDGTNSSAEIINRQFIADLLYEALQALDSDRLLTPVDDNAHGRFKRVLAYEPGNDIALQGLKDIVQRYLQLAQQSTRRGLFEEARTFIDNAKFIDGNDSRIEPVWLALQAELSSNDLFFILNTKEFSARTETAIAKLEDIARQARQANAFFLITAPNDELGRWMFAVMRDAVAGYRLRGNIELSSQTSIRLRLPKTVE
ncbi:MAG: hypothetical protein ACI95C_002982 [Pseudohongiellaceae bacterium]